MYPLLPSRVRFLSELIVSNLLVSISLSSHRNPWIRKAVIVHIRLDQAVLCQIEIAFENVSRRLRRSMLCGVPPPRSGNRRVTQRRSRLVLDRVEATEIIDGSQATPLRNPSHIS